MTVSRGAVMWHANADIVSTCMSCIIIIPISIFSFSTNGVEWPLPCTPHQSVADELPKSGRPLLIIPAPDPRLVVALRTQRHARQNSPSVTFAPSHSVAKAGEIFVSETKKKAHITRWEESGFLMSDLLRNDPAVCITDLSINKHNWGPMEL